MRPFNILDTVGFMLRHPLGKTNKVAVINRFLRWQIGSRLLNSAVAIPFVGNTRLLMKTGMHGATMNWYVGIQEFEDVAFLLHMLGSNDVFVDVGANVGVYTVLAAGVKGAHVVAVEPIPSTYEDLLDNIYINRLINRVSAKNIGLGYKEGELRFSTAMGPKNHVVSDEDLDSSIAVSISTLDILLEDSSPLIIKIDVEGFEQAVIKGGGGVLSSPTLLALIVELNGLGAHYGYSDHGTDALIRKYGFVPATYNPYTRHVKEVSGPNGSGNTLYVRSCHELKERLTLAEKIEVNGNRF